MLSQQGSTAHSQQLLYLGPPQLNCWPTSLPVVEVREATATGAAVVVDHASASLTFAAAVLRGGDVVVFGHLDALDAPGEASSGAGGGGASSGGPPMPVITTTACGAAAGPGPAAVSGPGRRFRLVATPTADGSAAAAAAAIRVPRGVAGATRHPGRAFVQVACGRAHLLALCDSGHVFCWGTNDHGQLGLLGVDSRSSPQLVPLTAAADAKEGAAARSVAPARAQLTAAAWAGCARVAAGSDHCLFVAGDGRAWSWGKGLYGQLGIGRPTAAQVRPRGHAGGAGAVRDDEEEEAALATAPVTGGSCGGGGAGGSGSGGGGEGYDGALHLNSVPPHRVVLPAGTMVVGVAAGAEHSVFVDSRGRLHSCGWGLYHQLGLGDTANVFTPQAVTRVARLRDERRHRRRRKQQQQQQQPCQDGGSGGGGACNGVVFVQVACGTWHSAALDAAGALFTWGWGKFGQLGPRSSSSSLTGQGGSNPTPEMDDDADAEEGGHADAATDAGQDVPQMCHIPSEVWLAAAPPAPPPAPGGSARSLPLPMTTTPPLMVVGCGARYTLVCTRTHVAYFGGVLGRHAGAVGTVYGSVSRGGGGGGTGATAAGGGGDEHAAQAIAGGATAGRWMPVGRDGARVRVTGLACGPSSAALVLSPS